MQPVIKLNRLGILTTGKHVHYHFNSLKKIIRTLLDVDVAITLKNKGESRRNGTKGNGNKFIYIVYIGHVR